MLATFYSPKSQKTSNNMINGMKIKSSPTFKDQAGKFWNMDTSMLLVGTMTTAQSLLLGLQP